MKELVACTENTDHTEGKGGTRVVCLATSKEVALQIVNCPEYYGKHGVMGCKPYKNGEYDIQTGLLAFESLEEYTAWTAVDEKAAALQKLTESEKHILGLNK